MRRWLGLTCRAFPPEHRARRSDEVVDTALLAATGSMWRGLYEGLSLVSAGLRQRQRVERGRSVGDGIFLLACVLATGNLSIALAGIARAIHPPPAPVLVRFLSLNGNGDWTWVYSVGWWWVAFVVAASGCVVGLVLGSRKLMLVAALANLGIVAYDAIVLFPHRFSITAGNGGHLRVFGYFQAPGQYPVGREWVVPAMLLALTMAVTPLRSRSLTRIPLAFLVSAGLVALSWAGDGFFYLRWPLAVIVVVALAFGWFAPRLAILSAGLSLAAVWAVVGYMTPPRQWDNSAGNPVMSHPDPVMSWGVAAAVSLGIVLPLAYLTRRRRLT